MNSLTLIIQVVALVCWFFATLGLFPNPRFNWWYAGWFFLLLSRLVSGIQLHEITR